MAQKPLTSCVLLTPPGAGAIAVIRVVGANAATVVDKLFRPAGGESLLETAADRVRYGRLIDQGETLDDVLVTRQADGDGGSGEAMAVDICTHGGVRIVERIIEALERLGAPLTAEPVHSPLSMPGDSQIEREAMAALIGSGTPRAVRFLAWQCSHLPAAMRAIEARWSSDPGQALDLLRDAIACYDGIRALLDGITVALIGPPNSGKSTLFNHLLGRQATVVSDQPGTTRDWVSGAVEMAGVPVTLVDTAGDRLAPDGLERAAVRAGRGESHRADVRVLVLDGSETGLGDPCIRVSLASLIASADVVVLNKADLGRALVDAPFGQKPLLRMSATTGEGVEAIAGAILGRIGRLPSDTVPALFTPRQHQLARAVLVEAGAATDKAMMLHKLVG